MKRLHLHVSNVKTSFTERVNICSTLDLLLIMTLQTVFPSNVWLAKGFFTKHDTSFYISHQCIIIQTSEWLMHTFHEHWHSISLWCHRLPANQIAALQQHWTQCDCTGLPVYHCNYGGVKRIHWSFTLKARENCILHKTFNLSCCFFAMWHYF